MIYIYIYIYSIKFFIKALIERGDDAAKQSVDDEGNSFLHVAAWSGALTSIKARDGAYVHYIASN